MALNTFKCNHLMTLHFKFKGLRFFGLNCSKTCSLQVFASCLRIPIPCSLSWSREVFVRTAQWRSHRGAKFRFFRGLHCRASPWRKIAYSITHSPSLFDAPRTEACASEQPFCSLNMALRQSTNMRFTTNTIARYLITHFLLC